MNPYIKKITCETADCSDFPDICSKFEKLEGKATKYIITVWLKQTPEGNDYALFVNNVKLKNERGEELIRHIPEKQKKLYENGCHTVHVLPKLHFYFDLDSGFCELQENSVFEITLYERKKEHQSLKYILSGGSWKEVTEEQS